MTTFDPQPPSKGWALRWAVQGAHLCLRALPWLIVLWAATVLVVIVAVSALITPILGSGLLPPALAQTVSMYAVLTALTVITTLLMFAIVQVIMVADDHRPTISLLRIQDLGSALRHTSIFVIFNVVLAVLLQGAAGTSLDEAGRQQILIDESFIAVLLHLGAILTTIHLEQQVSTAYIVTVLWMPLFIAFGHPLGVYLTHTGRSLFLRMPGVFFGIVLGGIVAGHVLLAFPFWVALPGLMVMIAWLYVGAREIFAGITRNSARNPFSILSSRDQAAPEAV